MNKQVAGANPTNDPTDGIYNNLKTNGGAYHTTECNRGAACL